MLLRYCWMIVVVVVVVVVVIIRTLFRLDAGRVIPVHESYDLSDENTASYSDAEMQYDCGGGFCHHHCLEWDRSNDPCGVYAAWYWLVS